MTSPFPHLLRGLETVVVGSGITGLAAARVLSDRGARVTILERDDEPAATDTNAAFASWKRRGAPQVRHSHAFLGRLRSLLRDHYPDILESLLEAGAVELDMVERPPLTLPPIEKEPGDDDFIALGCRRTTLEWVVRKIVLADEKVDLVAGAKVIGLLADETDSGEHRVSGVRCEIDGRKTEIDADIVVDASGRGSRAPAWLREIGAGAPDEEESSSGIIYFTRFYRFHEGASDPERGEHPGAADYVWIKYGVFPADGRTFSITFAVPLVVPRLKILSDARAFDTMVRALPGAAVWADPALAEPIGDPQRPVLAMGGLINRRRRFVVDGAPLALGFFSLGDAAYCTNPLYGRGCSQAFVHAHFMGEALDASNGDLGEALIELDRRSRQEIEPFYEASVIADKDAVRKAEGRPANQLANRIIGKFIEDGVIVGTRCDPVIFRAFLRMFNMFDPPEKAFFNRTIIMRSLWILARGKRYRARFALPPPPDKESTITACERAAAA